MFNIALIGVGQLGSRYLQGLVNTEAPCDIWIFDKHKSAYEIALLRWSESGGLNSKNKLNFVEKLESIPNFIDLAIIATTADVRPQAVMQLLEHRRVRYWILEKVLAQSLEGLEAIYRSISSSDGAWVNTPRRAMAWHRKLASMIEVDEPFSMRVYGGDWGLACNAIHFLDFADYIFNEDLLSVNASNLHRRWLQSKRKGFYEVFGELQANFKNGSILSLNCNEKSESVKIVVSTKRGEWSVAENEGVAMTPSGEIIIGRMEFQSEISSDLIDGILLGGKTLLPSLKHSLEMHKKLITELLDHWNQTRNIRDQTLPIT